MADHDIESLAPFARLPAADDVEEQALRRIGTERVRACATFYPLTSATSCSCAWPQG